MFYRNLQTTYDQQRLFMPDIGGDEGGDLGNLSPAAGSRDRAPVGDLGGEVLQKLQLLCIFSAKNIVLFDTVWYHIVEFNFPLGTL